MEDLRRRGHGVTVQGRKVPVQHDLVVVGAAPQSAASAFAAHPTPTCLDRGYSVSHNLRADLNSRNVDSACGAMRLLRDCYAIATGARQAACSHVPASQAGTPERSAVHEATRAQG
jgi:hypothetical protein